MSTALVTGGARFIGTNLADRLLREGRSVVVLDDLSRPGVRENLQWLQANHPRRLRVVIGDVRDPQVVRTALRGVREVFHFAAQVAVTTSLEAPRHDFAVNLAGTLNLLEELRHRSDPPVLLFTSTNKVYGGLDDIERRELDTRFAAELSGVNEARPLAFCSPYGCSKGAADQYVLDYAASFGLRTVVFRMSCIYGPHQQGNEDQGWVAHFVRQALQDAPITVYGDGRQVRDVLFVDDLLDAMQLAVGGIERLSGQAFNIGGGPGNTLSLLELLDVIAELTGARPRVRFGDWRTGDQRWYVSDFGRFTAATGWAPTVDVRQGLERLFTSLRGLPAMEAS
jgi:CDP-paratose 2-epimerase